MSTTPPDTSPVTTRTMPPAVTSTTSPATIPTTSPFLPTALALTRRALVTCLRLPALVVSPLLMSGFFLLLYDGQLSTVGDALAPGRPYVAIVLPLCLLTTAFTGGAVAGQLLVRDITSGYHARLALTPTRRSVLVVAPVAAGLIVLTVESTLLVALGGLMGLRPEHGLAAAAGLVLGTVLVGAGFLLLATAAALHAGTDAAVNAVSMVFFPLSLLTPMLVPRDRLGGWMAPVADLNPLTYVLEGLRALTGPTWSGGTLGRSGVAVAVLLVCGLVAVRVTATRRVRKGV